MFTSARRLGALAIAATFLFAACSSSASTPSPAATTAASSAGSGGTTANRCTKGDGQLNGAGSTLIYPLLSKMGADYNTLCSVKLNYQSIGSGGGVTQFINNTVDFGASDAFLKDSEITQAQAKGTPVEIPATFSAVVVAYNLSGLSAPLKLTPDVVAKIFLGTITTWNDPAIATLNPGITLPSTAISVVHRSDGSGTNATFTDYLTKVSPDWVAKVGAGDPTKSAGKTVNWPVGIGASGNEGVTTAINQTVGGVGYIDIAYALANKIAFADLQNKSGAYITPSLASVAAAANLPSYPADLRFSLTNTDAADGYPIASVTWLIVYQDLSKTMSSEDRAKSLVDFLWWAIHDGQADSAPLFYASIPPNLLAQDEKAVKSITWGGQALLP